MDEKSLSPLFPEGGRRWGGRGAVVTNDWCITEWKHMSNSNKNTLFCKGKCYEHFYKVSAFSFIPHMASEEMIFQYFFPNWAFRLSNSVVWTKLIGLQGSKFFLRLARPIRQVVPNCYWSFNNNLALLVLAIIQLSISRIRLDCNAFDASPMTS